MQIALDERFDDERKRFALVCACEQCAYFAPEGRGHCAHGYPNEMHRAEAFEPTATDTVRRGVFCKEFELA